MGYLERVFEIARDIDPDQPLTAAPGLIRMGMGFRRMHSWNRFRKGLWSFRISFPSINMKILNG